MVALRTAFCVRRPRRPPIADLCTLKFRRGGAGSGPFDHAVAALPAPAGELPQAFYIRPAPEGRAKARGGKQRKRPRAAAEPGAAVLDAYGMPVAAAPPAAAPARSRPAARAALAAEERAALAASRKRRLLQVRRALAAGGTALACWGLEGFEPLLLASFVAAAAAS